MSQITFNVIWDFKDLGNRIAHLISGIVLLALAIVFGVTILILRRKFRSDFPRLYKDVGCRLLVVWLVGGSAIALRAVYNIGYYLYVRRATLSE